MALETITDDSSVDALVALVRELIAYEQRYQMGSAEFFAQYQQGTLGDSADVVAWAGEYQHDLSLLQEIKAHVNAVGRPRSAGLGWKSGKPAGRGLGSVSSRTKSLVFT